MIHYDPGPSLETGQWLSVYSALALSLSSSCLYMSFTLCFCFLGPNCILYPLFIFGLCWVFIAARGLSLVAVSSGFSCMQYADFWSCDPQAWVSCSMQNLLRPGIIPTSPALASGFLTTGPPGKSYILSSQCAGSICIPSWTSLPWDQKSHFGDIKR